MLATQSAFHQLQEHCEFTSLSNEDGALELWMVIIHDKDFDPYLIETQAKMVDENRKLSFLDQTLSTMKLGGGIIVWAVFFYEVLK